MMEQNIWIGIHLGGTNIRVAAIDQSGNILEEVQQLTNVEKGPEAIIDIMIDMTTRLQSYPQAKAIGIGAPGPLDAKKGIILAPPNLPRVVTGTYIKTTRPGSPLMDTSQPLLIAAQSYFKKRHQTARLSIHPYVLPKYLITRTRNIQIAELRRTS